MYTPESSTTERPAPRRRALTGKLAAVGLTGLLVGSAVAVGSMASADEPVTTDQEQVAEPAPIDEIELSPEDEGVLERYDDCLTENGVPSFDEADEAEIESMTEEDWEAFDAAWEAAAETCDPILTELSDDVLVDGDVVFDDIELSPEDEAVFERFDQCLAENGVPMPDEVDEGVLDDITDADFEAFEEAYEAAAEACEPILDELSDDVVFGGLVEGCDLDEAELAEDVAPADA